MYKLCRSIIVVAFCLIICCFTWVIPSFADVPEEKDAEIISYVEATESEDETSENTEDMPAEETETTISIDWLENELITKAISAIIMFATMWISTRPQTRNNNLLANKLVDFSSTFSKNKEDTEKRVSEMLKKYEEMEGQLNNMTLKISDYIEQVYILTNQVKILTEMTKLGFGENTELVKKGVASKIYKLYKENGIPYEVIENEKETN